MGADLAELARLAELADLAELSRLAELVRAELAGPAAPEARCMAEAIARRHGAASRAVLFYGSCLREQRLDGRMLDFYLIVSDYRAAYDRRWLAAANRLVPPNVFHFTDDGLVAKYAVLSEADFHRLTGPETRGVSVWARFAQPSRLLWSAGDEAAGRVVAAVARAAPTLLAAAGRRDGEEMLDWWRRAFALTYSAELRAERHGRGGSVIEADPRRYLEFGAAAVAAIAGQPRFAGAAAAGWRRRRIEGKLLSVVRLAKASATFAGGADYIVWKINRHAGTRIRLTRWQRRWPLLAALSLVPRLLRSGAIR